MSDVILDPGNPDGDGDDWRPSVTLEHDADRNELYIITGEEAAGMVEGISAESFEAMKARLS